MEPVIALGSSAFTDISDVELIRQTISLKALPFFFPEQDEIAGLRSGGREIEGDAPVGIIQGSAIKAPKKKRGCSPTRSTTRPIKGRKVRAAARVG